MVWQRGDSSPLQYACLENPMEGGAHGVAKSRTRLSNFTFTFHFHALEKEMATHSSVLAWRIPGTGEPGGLRSVGSHRVGHNWSDFAAAAASGLEAQKSLFLCSPNDECFQIRSYSEALGVRTLISKCSHFDGSSAFQLAGEEERNYGKTQDQGLKVQTPSGSPYLYSHSVRIYSHMATLT